MNDIDTKDPKVTAIGCGLSFIFLGAFVGSVALGFAFGAHVGFASYALFCIALGIWLIILVKRSAKKNAD